MTSQTHWTQNQAKIISYKSCFVLRIRVSYYNVTLHLQQLLLPWREQQNPHDINNNNNNDIIIYNNNCIFFRVFTDLFDRLKSVVPIHPIDSNGKKLNRIQVFFFTSHHTSVSQPVCRGIFLGVPPNLKISLKWPKNNTIWSFLDSIVPQIFLSY